MTAIREKIYSHPNNDQLLVDLIDKGDGPLLDQIMDLKSKTTESLYTRALLEAVKRGNNKAMAYFLMRLPLGKQYITEEILGILLAQNNHNAIQLFLSDNLSKTFLLIDAFLRYLALHPEFDQEIALNNLINYLDTTNIAVSTIQSVVRILPVSTEQINGSLILYMLERTPVDTQKLDQFIKITNSLPTTNQVLRELRAALGREKL